MRVSFWPLLLGVLLLVFGVVGVANDIFKLRIAIPWTPMIAVIIGIWILTHAFKRR